MSTNLAQKATDLTLALIAIDSPSKEEKAAREDLIRRFQKLGLTTVVDARGNLIASLEATKDYQKEPVVLLCSHMDTVPNAVGPTVVIDKGIIGTDGLKALGADDKAATAAILVALEHLIENNLPHGPIKVLCTVEEEPGLQGVKDLDYSLLGPIGRGYVLDAEGPIGGIIVKAAAKSDVKITFSGKAAHAGFAPQKGISAISAAAKAITEMKLLQVDEQTTANVGLIKGGEATNIVSDWCEIDLEVRSYSQEKLKKQLAHLEICCIKAIGAIGGSYEFMTTDLFPGYTVDHSDANLLHVQALCEQEGLPWRHIETFGGSDTSYLRQEGVPVLTLTSGYIHPHSPKEHIEIQQLEALTRLTIALCAPLKG